MAILDFLDCFFSTEEGGWLFYSKDRGIFFIGKSNGSWLGTDEASDFYFYYRLQVSKTDLSCLLSGRHSIEFK